MQSAGWFSPCRVDRSSSKVMSLVHARLHIDKTVFTENYLYNTCSSSSLYIQNVAYIFKDTILSVVREKQEVAVLKPSYTSIITPFVQRRNTDTE